MTSMLYIASDMNSKPNDPEECINLKKVSWRTDTKVNYFFGYFILIRRYQ